MDERALTERLITYDTSTLEGMQAAAGFVKGWLEARDVEVIGTQHNGRPLLTATVGPESGPTVVLHGHLDVVPGPPGAVRAARGRRPPVRARRLRHEGRPRGDDLRVPRRGRSGGRARPLHVRVGRGVRGDRRPRLRPPGEERLPRRLRHHGRAHRPPHRHPGEGRARHARRGHRHGRARLHSVGRRQRRAEGDRHLPPDREPAVRARVLGPVRPAVDQPRPDRGRRRHEQGPRPLRHRRGHPLPARARTTRRSARRSRSCPTCAW